MVRAGFNAEYGLVTATEEGLAYPQPRAGALPQGLVLLAMLGAVLGKALYEGILLDVSLAPFFVARLQGRRPLLEDLAGLDPALHRSLLHLKRCATGSQTSFHNAGILPGLHPSLCQRPDHIACTCHHVSSAPQASGLQLFDLTYDLPNCWPVLRQVRRQPRGSRPGLHC